MVQLKKFKLHHQIFAGIILGVLVGLITPGIGLNMKPIGDIFIGLLKMIIVPLVLASIVVGVASLGDFRRIGKLGVWTLGYFVATTLSAIGVGLILVNLIKPGVRGNLLAETIPDLASQAPSSLGSVLIQVIPENVVEAMGSGNMVAVIFFAVLLGAAITSMPQRGKPLYDFFDGLNSIMMTITNWVMHIAPVGVFALMAHVVAKTGIGAFKPLGLYFSCVLMGLTIHCLITMPIISISLGKYSPVKLFNQLLTAFGTAFSTSSSATTMPITMDALNRRVGVSPRVTGFVVPLGTTINMDGTALFQAVAAVFIAQVYGIELGIVQYAIIALTATLASIGAAAIPSAGLVTLVMILKAIHVPIEGIGLILAVDRILDMFRTTTNVWGNSIGTLIMARLDGEKLHSKKELSIEYKPAKRVKKPIPKTKKVKKEKATTSYTGS